MPRTPRVSSHPPTAIVRWALRVVAAAALLIGIAALAVGSSPAGVSAQAGAINVSISASPNPAAVGQTVTFSLSATPPAVTPPQPTITSLTVNYGDGFQVSIPPSAGSVTHEYGGAGVFTATLTATDSAGHSGSGSVQVQVVALTPPTVQIAPVAQTALVGQQVSFQYAVSTGVIIGGTPALTISASFGDGAMQQVQSPTGTISHTYTAPGTYTVTISAAFPGGTPGTGSATVVVGAVSPPTVTLTATPTSVAPGGSVTFSYTITPSATSVTIRSASISFGDGNTAVLTATSGTTTHTYAQQGTFTATLAATDSNGQTGQQSVTITVAPPAVSGQPLSGVTFVSPPTTGTAGQPVSVTVGTATTPNSGASIASYSINFGDQSAAVTATPGQPVMHTYTTPGTYTITLTVTDSTGVSTMANTPIVIAAAGLPVQYAAGWNLVAGPTGTIVTGNAGPLYSFPPGATAYQTVANGTPLQAGQGYWAFFPTATTSSIAFITPGTPATTTVQAPSGQFFLVGNPGNTNATISGADVVDAFDPTSNTYTQTTTLRPGEAAWVFSAAGGQITITNAAQ